MYGYEIEVKDDALWLEKMNIFKVVLPILTSPVSESGLENGDEIRSTFIKCFLDTLSANQDITHQVLFKEDDSDFYKEIIKDENVMKEIIEILVKNKNLKVFIDASVFMINQFGEDSFEFIKGFFNSFDIKGDFMPETLNDLFILNDLRYSNNSILALFGVRDLNNYSKPVSNDFIRVLVNLDILTFNSLESAIMNDTKLVTDGRECFDFIITFFEEFINNKCEQIENRYKVIDVLEIDNASNRFLLVAKDALNEVLLKDNEKVNIIKTEWLQKTLNADNDDREEE